LRSSPSTELAPLILLLEENQRHDRTAAHRSGADAVLTKPVELDEVLTLVARMDNRRGDSMTLTPAERRVAIAVARGLTNKQIAEELDVSVRTVENHVSNILSKMGFSNRVELTRYVLRTRLRS
jgi:DNA-binding NarL/FixJ family response regulator